MDETFEKIGEDTLRINKTETREVETTYTLSSLMAQRANILSDLSRVQGELDEVDRLIAKAVSLGIA